MTTPDAAPPAGGWKSKAKKTMVLVVLVPLLLLTLYTIVAIPPEPTPRATGREP